MTTRSSHRVAVLGVGRVGETIVRDLAADPDITVVAVDTQHASLGRVREVAEVVRVDVLDANELSSLLRDIDLVVGAVPGSMGFRTVRTVIECGKPVVDISFFPEDPFGLDELARNRDVTVVVDAGVAPGLSNLVLGGLLEDLDQVSSFTCFVGGLPEKREPPWEYKAPFSPADVIEEYTRPVRLRRRGVVEIVDPLTDVEILSFAEIGTLEAFNTDGLRTLLRTTEVPELAEKTLRYPGHAAKISLLKESGFFARETLDVGGTSVRPIDVSSRLLFSQWQYADAERDVTVMRLVGEGLRDNRPVQCWFDLVDRYDADTNTRSMSRTTGYTCTAIARLVVHGVFHRAGINAPEVLGRDRTCYDSVLRNLTDRNVRLERREESTSA